MSAVRHTKATLCNNSIPLSHIARIPMNSLSFLISFLLIGSNLLKGQEFVFSMIFSDPFGNSDTLFLGYDENATEGLDEHYGEIDIMETPWDSLFEVRVTHELRQIDATPIENFHTKKQITKKDCDTIYPPVIEIDIKSIHWPVTARWCQDLFMDSCNRGSLMTSIVPGGWWDVGSPSDLDKIELKNDSIISFTDNADFSNGKVNDIYAYEHAEAGLISVFWIALGMADLGITTIPYKRHAVVQISPNPVHDIITIDGISDPDFSRIELHTIQGRKILQTREFNISLIDLPPGVYFLSIVYSKGYRLQRKIVKN
jgi:hypothetical protein